MSVLARLAKQRFDPETELSALLEQASADGAIVSFVGLARPAARSGELVERLVLEHHPTLTERSIQDIAAAAAQRFDVSHVRVVHRCGEVPAGDPIVFAGAASPHRRAAFDAADYLMDRLKTEAVFWKREISDGRSEWIEPTETDYSDRDRWR
ncbi:MAG TPA: molybdenum cofactor biosynthesis protein MoaE [Sphingomicrobium sp.]